MEISREGRVFETSKVREKCVLEQLVSTKRLKRDVDVTHNTQTNTFNHDQTSQMYSKHVTDEVYVN